ncbi:MAG: hypothetical protein ACI39F_06880, partial [Acutalibacteraceae bacterium]
EFDANGGDDDDAADMDFTADENEVITLPVCTIAPPAGKQFKAWEIGGKEYQPGDKYTVTGNITVTAIWQDKAPKKAIDSIQITNLPEAYVIGGTTIPLSPVVNGNAIILSLGGEIPVFWVPYDSNTFSFASFKGDFMEKDDVYTSDKYYYVLMPLAPKTGYQFTSSTKVTMNGKTAQTFLVNIPGTEDFALYVAVGYDKETGRIIPDNYSVNISGGKATDSKGSAITAVAPGTKVTITANAAPTGKVFDKWVVVSGGVILSNANSSTTTFIMPEGAVEIRATYKSVVETPSTGTTITNSIKFGGVTYTLDKNGEYVGKKAKVPSITKLLKAKKAFKAKWKKISGVKGYQIQYSTSKKFTKKASKKVLVKSNKAKSPIKLIKKLKGNKKYFVRIRTYTVVNGKKLYSSWSKAKSVKTKK